MPKGDQVERWRVFLASPGDVEEERAFVRHFLLNILPGTPLLGRRMVFDVVSWDGPHGTTMPANMTPQDAVTRFHGAPDTCAIVIVILWSRMGTLLDGSHEKKSDGSAYLSGTEWEYENAMAAPGMPEILVYRRTEPVLAVLGDPQHDEKVRQYALAQAFFKRFENSDGSARGSYQSYGGVEAFKRQFAADIERIAAEHLSKRPSPIPPADTVDPASIDPPDRCFGRDAQIADLTAALTGDRDAVIAVLGPGGIGKTTLTRKVAADEHVAARFGVRRWFAPLETALDAAALRTAVVVALGLDPVDPKAFERALALLGREKALLVLDNTETPWEADMAATQDALRRLAAVPGLSLLLSLRGAVVPPGPVFTHREMLAPLLVDDAKRLFLDIAPHHAGDPVLTAFLTELGGMPLAVELVARRAEPLADLAELWAQWQAHGVALARNPDLPPDRRTSVVRSIDLSWQSNRLRDPGKRLFRLLGCSPAGLSPPDRQALLGDDAFDAAEQVLRVGLAFNREGRLDLLPPVRRFAQALAVAESGELDCWRRHFLKLAELGKKIGREGGGEAAARLTPEMPNVEAAFAVALTEDARPAALAATEGYGDMVRWSGLGRPVHLEALGGACSQAQDWGGEAACRFQIGLIAFYRSEHDAAREALEQALALYRRVDDVRGKANCIKGLGDIALAHSEHDPAEAAFKQALLLYRRIGSVLGATNCIQSLGHLALARSDHDAAKMAFERALPQYRKFGAVLGKANCIAALGEIALARSDHNSAQKEFEQAMFLYRQVGAVLGEANCIKGLGEIALARSEHDAAEAAFKQALRLFSRIYDAVGEGNCLMGLGAVAQATHDPAAARGQYRAALGLYEQAGARNNMALAHEQLAGIATGEEREAHMVQARAIWTDIGLPDRAAGVK